MGLIQFVLVGLVAGWMMGRIRRGKGYGLIGNLVIGGLGALIGNFVSGFLNISPSNSIVSVAMAVVGAVVFFLVVDAFRPRKRGKSSEEADT